jgi:hypothetical protein
MKVPLIEGPHIGVGHMQSKVEKQLAKHSFVEEGGMYNIVFDIANLILHCSFSVLPALSLTEGIIHCDILEGAFDTGSFYTFIERTLDQMQPYPSPNSVLVMDNCRIHKHPAIQELIESRSAYSLLFRQF